ncbi:hypothetical protein RIF29_38463 [Crotalaria pallida]|uniref:Uncharacterized protein n=1 Tax=Crotalaria pallida TaxID=3830 RepID=A0AAN9E4R9_CROPI
MSLGAGTHPCHYHSIILSSFVHPLHYFIHTPTHTTQHNTTESLILSFPSLHVSLPPHPHRWSHLICELFCSSISFSFFYSIPFHHLSQNVVEWS